MKRKSLFSNPLFQALYFAFLGCLLIAIGNILCVIVGSLYLVMAVAFLNQWRKS